MKQKSEYLLTLGEILFLETADSFVAVHTAKDIFETKQKLYEIEHLLEEKQFLRVSKSVIVNLMKIKAIKPAMNGRFIAVLQNSEEVIISRKYVSALKNKLKEGK